MRRGIKRADVLGVMVITFVVMIIAVVRVAVVAGSRALGFVVTDAAACGADDAAAFAEPAAVESLGGQAGNCCQGEQSEEPTQGGMHSGGLMTWVPRDANGIYADGLTGERNAWTRA